MPATKTTALWGRLTDLIAHNRNVDDELLFILEHCRDGPTIAAAARARYELERWRQELLNMRDAQKDDER